MSKLYGLSSISLWVVGQKYMGYKTKVYGL